MTNYYEVLNIDQSSSADEIKKKIRAERKVWRKRTNAPTLEKRQQAERIVQALQEAEEILLDSGKRADYDKKLRTAPAETTAPMDQATLEGKADLVAEAWTLIANGRYFDAQYVARQATEKDGENPEAWAVLAQTKLHAGEIQDALYEYKRAINLKPNHAEYQFDIGAVYESAEMWKEAYTSYQNAAKIEPKVPMYRAGIGALLMQLEQYREATDILEQCVREESDNEAFKYYLGLCYAQRAYENWATVEGQEGWYATEASHIDEAREFLQKVEALGVEDEELREGVAMMTADLEKFTKRKFVGHYLAPVAWGGIGVVGFSASPGLGILTILCAVAYIVSCFIPQYIINRRVVAGKEFQIPGLVWSVVLLPIMAILNFVKFWAMK